MTPRLIRALALLLMLPMLSACAQAIIGAAGVVIADEVAEDRGGDLF